MRNMENKVEKKYYKNHPKFNLFAANKAGRVIEFPSLKQVDSDDEGNIKVKTKSGREKVYSKITLIWECHHGLKRKDEYVCKLGNGDDDCVMNLKICKVVVKRLSPEEQLERNKQNRAKWRNTVWDCPLCSFRTTNSVKWSHKRFCKYSNVSFTEEERQKKKQSDDAWRNKPFDCSICDKSYKNGYKYLHTMICEKKHREME